MTRRRPAGLTLLETLLSVVLLTAVLAAGASWTASAARVGTEFEGPARWERAAHEVIALVRDDLGSTDPNARRRAPRVRVDGGALLIDTRHVVALGDDAADGQGRAGIATVLHRYRHDARSGRLELVESDPATGRRRPRVLLESVASVRFVVDEDRRRVEIELVYEGTDPARHGGSRGPTSGGRAVRAEVAW